MGGFRMELFGDVWVNWCEDESKSHKIVHFFEWRRHDFIEVIDEIPLLLIDPDLFCYIENSLNPLPVKLLEAIEGMTYIRRNNRRERIKYACILTDGKGVLVVDTKSSQLPHKKSRLIPRQEKWVLEKAEKMEVEKFEYEPIKKKENIFTDVPNEYMLGLNRRERALKELLFYILEQLKYETNIHKLIYYYLEFKHEDIDELYKLSYEEIFTMFFSDIKQGWTDNHHNLLLKLISLNDTYKKIYNQEMLYKVVAK